MDGDDPILGPADSLFLYTDTHYAVLRVAKDRKRFRGDQPTDAEAAEAFRAMAAAAGTYTLSGSKMTSNQELSRTPGAAPQTHEITFDGPDRLRGTFTMRDGRKIDWAMRRIASPGGAPEPAAALAQEAT
jgi:hypothetical protein